MAEKVRADYKQAFDRLVEAIHFDSRIWRVKSEQSLATDLDLRYDGMCGECEYLLEQAEKFEAECKGLVNENGRVSLHLYDCAQKTFVYDLDCNVGEVPERVWCEYMCTIQGYGYYFDTQENHMHNVRMNGEYGVPLQRVWLSSSFRWENDRGQVVDGPKVWIAKYLDTAFAAC